VIKAVVNLINWATVHEAITIQIVRFVYQGEPILASIIKVRGLTHQG
jgi:hypothetical protein